MKTVEDLNVKYTKLSNKLGQKEAQERLAIVKGVKRKQN
jgi:hypothetical protein